MTKLISFLTFALKYYTALHAEEVKPYEESGSKKEQVAEMFDNVSGHYDFLNHFLSLGIDVWWRKKTIRQLKNIQVRHLLDVATGTADLAIEALNLKPEKIIGIDLSAKMLAIGAEKVKKYNGKIELMQGDSENLPFADQSFDAVTVAFGVRNFENIEKGIAEMQRVLREGGKLVVLEFSKPKNFFIKFIYNIYFLHILPLIGKIISKDQRAYTYLPESVQAFPEGDAFLEILQKNGFKHTQCIALTFGISSIYVGQK